MMKVKDLLNHPNRWLKGSFEKHGRYCLVGALQHCYPGIGRLHALQKIKQHLKITFESEIYALNDAKKTTFKDIRKIILATKI